MACNSSGSDTEVTSCSNECKESYAKLKKLYDAQREQLSDAKSIEIKAYTQGLKKVEAQLVAHQQGQLWYEQKIKFMKIDLDDKTDVLTYHKKLLAEAQKEKEDLKAKVEKWHNSSKNLGKLLNTQMSANDKIWLGMGITEWMVFLSYEKAGGMHAVPPPMTRNYMPLDPPDIEVITHNLHRGPKTDQLSESKPKPVNFDTCESNISTETPELVSELVVNESNVACQPKVWSDAPIIEEYKSDSEDEPFNKTTALRTKFSKQKVNTAKVNAVSAVGGKEKLPVKPPAGFVWTDICCKRVGKFFEISKIKCRLWVHFMTQESPLIMKAQMHEKNLVYHSKTNHIAIRHHFIRDAYEKKLIQVLKIHTDDNVADLLTKAFDVASVSTIFVEQFWMSAKSKIINNVRHITAKVAGKPVYISKASIRSDLLFDDADGIDSLPNQTIFDAIQLMG
ncbi:hypothetical protein Tco_0769707, partial [Tanacetum coccineum]